MINGYLKLGELEKAVFVFDGMEERNVVSWSSVLDGYCKNGKVGEAEVLFQKMPEKNVVSWTTMISGYMKSGQFAKGFELGFSDVHSDGLGSSQAESAHYEQYALCLFRISNIKPRRAGTRERCQNEYGI
ncbi:hypothetical protein MKW94_022717 [Papaver nudicaule]|uniref:Pentatricopeptide repeat-containing protein n=1 Tax=Papaver nudicaule TaxID=74823 RepID=A0AA41VBM9_PAPNU|nr:hypothetical protein [Papaver nudicaule]